jgi:hypothetical protein
MAKALNYVIGLVSGLLILLPAALALLYVRGFGVSVVYFDAWPIVLLFERWSSGRLHVLHLFTLHNEHRMFFPKGVELLLGSVTKYDNVPEMYLILICFLTTLVFLLLAFRDNTNKLWLILFVPVSFLVFSFRQYENMLFGFQLNFAFTQTFGVLALFLLHVSQRTSFRRSTFVAALGSATVASFSVVQGLLVWPVGLLQLFVSTVERSAKKVLMIVWGLAGLGEWIAYFIDYVKPKDHPSVLYALAHPAEGTEYLLTLLGSSLFWQHNSALVGGSLLICFALLSLLLIYKNRKVGEYSFWISLLLYSFLILVSVTLGRSGFGAEQALASRYTSFSILAVICVYALLVKTAFERRSKINTVLVVALSGVILLSTATSYSKGIEAGSKEKASREKAAFILSTYESQPDELLTKNLYPRPEIVREYAPILQRLGYNVFSELQTRGSLPPLSALSSIATPTLYSTTISGKGISYENDYVIVPQEAPFIHLTGWAVDVDNDSVAGGVYIDVDNELFPAFYGTDMKDVADSFGVPSYRYSGYERAIPVSEIGLGTHELSVLVLSSDRKGYYRPSRKVTLDVR